MSTARNCIRYSGSDFLTGRSARGQASAACQRLPQKPCFKATRCHAVAPTSWLDQTRGIALGSEGQRQASQPWENGKDTKDSCTLASLAFDAKSRAIKVQRKCGMFAEESVEQVTERLEDVLALLPGLAPRMSFHKARDLGLLMKDPGQLARSLTALSDLFPGQNVGELIIDDVQYAQQSTIEALPERIERIKAQLKLTDISAVFKRRPLLLDPDANQEALDDLESRLPEKYDAARMLLEMPCLIYPMNRVMLPEHLME